MTEQQIRESISTILVKHSMPTRQIAITEIVNLFTQEREELNQKLTNDLLIKCECDDGGCANCERLCKLLDEVKLY